MHDLFFFLNLICIHFLHSLAFYHLGESRFLPLTHFFLWAACFLLNAALGVLLESPASGCYSTGHMLLTQLLAAAVFLWSTEGLFLKRLFLVCCCYTCIFFIAFFGGWAASLGLSDPYLVMMVFKVASYALLLVWWRLRGRRRLDAATAGIEDSWGVLAFMSMVVFLCVTVLVHFVADWSGMKWLFTMLCMAAMVAVVYAVLVTTMALLQRSRDLSRLQAENMLLQSELSARKLSVLQASRQSHDLRHHNRLLEGMAMKGDLDGIRSYLAGYGAALEQEEAAGICGNKTLNAIIGNFMRQCSAQDIDLSVNLDFSSPLPLADTEACTLLGNVFDNARQACLGYQKVFMGERARIQLEGGAKGGSFSLQVKNSVAGTVEFKDGLPVDARGGVGLGVRSMLSTVESHGGRMEFEQSGRKFLVRIALPLEGRSWR